MINDQIRVIGLKIRNFRGIEDLSVAVDPSGTVFAGRNRAGKTSALKALRAALEAEGVGPDAIRHGASEAEIFVDLGAVTACRTIRPRGTSLEVRDIDGGLLPKPTAQLKELLGSVDLDPLAFYLADAKERRRLIMAAMPSKVTAEDLNKWCGETREWNTSGHGQEVLERVREKYYSQRMDANKSEDEAKARLALATQALSPFSGESAAGLTTEAARTVVAAAERELAILKDRRKQAAELDERAASFRTQIAELRRDAETLIGTVPTGEKQRAKDGLDAARARRAIANDDIITAREALAQAERNLKAADEAVADSRARLAAVEKSEFKADSLLKEASEREAALENLQAGQTAESLEAQIAEAEAELAKSTEGAKAAERRAEAAKVRAQHAEAKDAYARAKAAAVRLDEIVTRLTKEAPAELAKRENTIPGLQITTNAILLDGVNLDERSGAEQMRFAVELAKRLSARARILVVDGLERIDPEEQPKFIKMACEGGWQLFGSLVQRGELAVIGLKPDETIAWGDRGQGPGRNGQALRLPASPCFVSSQGGADTQQSQQRGACAKPEGTIA